MRRFMLAVAPDRPSKREETSPSPVRRPISLTPRIEPNLKSATLYPAERQMGFRIHERKKDKGPVPSDV